MTTFFLRNFWFRAFLPLVLMGIVGVSSNALVVEISQGNKIDWNLLTSVKSFYVLIFCSLLSAWYQIALQRFDADLAKGFTPKQYEAAIRNRLAEAVAIRSRKLIARGEIEKLEAETAMFKKLYGEGKS